jgi:hypothetical protein
MLHTTSKTSGRRPGPVTRRTDWTLVIAICWLTLLALGLLVVVLYGFSVNGRHLEFITVGLLTAGAAMSVGALTGFLFGIPRFVSLGKTREPGARAHPTADDDGVAWTPSTNLAEISDWLTKLLLGAGLVGLTSLGAPTAALVRNVARGMSDPGAPEASGASLVAAAAVLLLFTVLGFVMGYVLTTLWYSRALGALAHDQAGEMVVAPPVDAAPQDAAAPRLNGVPAPRS